MRARSLREHVRILNAVRRCDERMNIQIVNNLFRREVHGGAERSVSLLAGSFRALGHEVNVFALTSADSTAMVYPDGVRAVYKCISNSYWPYSGKKKYGVLRRMIWHMQDIWNPLMYDEIQAELERTRPDVVVTNVLAGISVAAWTAAKRLGVPVVHVIRDYYLLCPRSLMYKRGENCGDQCRGCAFFRAMKRRHCKEVDAVVGISRFVLERHGDFFGRGPYRRVIFNSVEVPVGAPRTPYSGVLRVGILGRVVEGKGIVEMATAFWKRKNVAARLLIGGDGDPALCGLLGNLARSDLRVEYLGLVQPDEFLATVDVLIIPSRWHEPFGRVVAEAHANGVPCLVRRVGGLPELVENAKTGWVFSTDEECIAKLEELARTAPAVRRMADACKASASRFRTEKIGTEYLSLFEEVVRSHKHGRPRETR